MALYTMDLENLNTLNTDDKVVQMTDMIQIHGETLAELLSALTSWRLKSLVRGQLSTLKTRPSPWI